MYKWINKHANMFVCVWIYMYACIYVYRYIFSHIYEINKLIHKWIYHLDVLISDLHTHIYILMNLDSALKTLPSYAVCPCFINTCRCSGWKDWKNKIKNVFTVKLISWEAPSSTAAATVLEICSSTSLSITELVANIF